MLLNMDEMEIVSSTDARLPLCFAFGTKHIPVSYTRGSSVVLHISSNVLFCVSIAMSTRRSDAVYGCLCFVHSFT